MSPASKIVIAISACVISFAVGVFVGYYEAGGDPYAELLGDENDPLTCPSPGDVLNDEVFSAGCVDEGSTTVRFLSKWDCDDGRMLLSEDRMYGFTGETIVASEDTSRDPAYAEAYRECVGS